MSRIVTNTYYELVKNDIETKGKLLTATLDLILSNVTLVNEQIRINNLKKRRELKEEGIPVLTRKYEITHKGKTEEIEDLPNQKINVDFFNEINSLNSSFIAGIPPRINLNKERYQKDKTIIEKFKIFLGKPDDVEIDEEKYSKDNQYLSSLLKRMFFNTITQQIADDAKTYGYGARRFYIRDKEIFVENIYPGNIVFISFEESNIVSSEYVIYFYNYYDYKKNNTKVKCDFYFIKNGEAIIQKYMTEGTSAKGFKFIENSEKPTGFDFIPVVGYQNNDIYRGDAERVLTIIDDHDDKISDWSSELKDHRLSLMLLINVTIDKKTKKDIAYTRRLVLNQIHETKKPDVRYLEKNLNIEALDRLIKKYHDYVFEVSQTANPADENFVGNSSGVAMKYKMLPFENKNEKTINYFMRADYQSFKVLCSGIKKLTAGKISIDENDIEINYIKNWPKDLLTDAQIQQVYDGLVSDETRLAQSEIVKNVEEEKLKMEKDNERFVDLDEEEAEDIKNEETDIDDTTIGIKQGTGEAEERT